MRIINGKKYLTLKEAAKKAGMSVNGMIKWCIDHNIGIKIVGRWLVDPQKLDDLLRANEKK